MKESILKELRLNRGSFISGEELSEKLGVSRTAIWKSINGLRDLGYVIESQTKRGYRLMDSPDSIMPFEILPLLNTQIIGSEIFFHESIDSTNNRAKKIANESFLEGTVIIAEEQTSGRGRLGRNWISPKGKGIWMSILLKPQINPADAAKITVLAACAVCQGIEKACGIDVKIKWPNDIVVNGKKLCGILTELGAEMDAVNYLVVGIGINANMSIEDLSEDIRETATSIRMEIGQEISRKQVTAYILEAFDQLYLHFIKAGGFQEIVALYKSKSAVLGKEIRAISKTGELIGIASDISEEGHLIIRLPKGDMIEVASGEVSVRGMYGYI